MNKKTPIATIGSRESVDFPRLGLLKIPAKVDTGADSSAIWVSDIKQAAGKLSFVFFAPGNRFYSGERITVKTYKTASVKNSSGNTEFRYKVRLVVLVRGRTIRAWFTLADRSGMTYPVLLGRRLLNNKFVVDVSQSMASKSGNNAPKRVLILVSKPKKPNDFYETLSKEIGTKARITLRSYKQLAFWVSQGSVIIKETETNKNIADFDLVYFKSHRTYHALAAASAQYLSFNNVKFFDKELIGSVAYDKLSVYVRLALHNMSVPASYSAVSSEMKDKYKMFSKTLGLPFVFKEINSDRGKNNYLINTPKQFTAVLKDSQVSDIFIAQQYIENDGYVRAYVFGNEASPIVVRKPVYNKNPLKAHLNQPKGSVNASLIPENDPRIPEIQDTAVRASQIMNRQITGIDLIQDEKTGEWFVLEVNGAPQLKTGSFTQEKFKALAKFIDNELNR
jgi:glutathione synthase/RimK-type ligase-like ATP-grasp enzyme